MTKTLTKLDTNGLNHDHFTKQHHYTSVIIAVNTLIVVAGFLLVPDLLLIWLSYKSFASVRLTCCKLVFERQSSKFDVTVAFMLFVLCLFVVVVLFFLFFA